MAATHEEAMLEVHLRARRRSDDVRRIRELLRLELREKGASVPVLQSESMLAKRFGVSRNAVRDALALLRDEGLIERRQGAGTLVRGLPAPLAGNSWQGMARSLKDAPTRVRYEIIWRGEVPALGTVADILGRRESERLGVFERVTWVDGVASCVWTTYLAVAHLRELVDDGSDGIALIEHATGTCLARLESRVEAVLADEPITEILGVRAGQPLLRIERTLYDATGKAVAISFGRIRGDFIGIVVSGAMPGAGP